LVIKEGQRQKLVIKEGQRQKLVIKEGQRQKLVIKEGQRQKLVIKEGQKQKLVIQKKARTQAGRTGPGSALLHPPGPGFRLSAAGRLRRAGNGSAM